MDGTRDIAVLTSKTGHSSLGDNSGRVSEAPFFWIEDALPLVWYCRSVIARPSARCDSDCRLALLGQQFGNPRGCAAFLKAKLRMCLEVCVTKRPTRSLDSCGMVPVGNALLQT